MSVTGTRSARRPHLATARALGVALGCSLALAAWAQSVNIPDFRLPLPSKTSVTSPGEPCIDCGRIVSIREIRSERKPAASTTFQSSSSAASSGPAGPNLVGAVIYMPLGRNNTERPFVGGVGTPEMKERFQESTYQVTVRFDDGSLRSIQRYDGAHYQVGDRVKLTATEQLQPVQN